MISIFTKRLAYIGYYLTGQGVHSEWRVLVQLHVEHYSENSRAAFDYKLPITQKKVLSLDPSTLQTLYDSTRLVPTGSCDFVLTSKLFLGRSQGGILG